MVKILKTAVIVLIAVLLLSKVVDFTTKIIGEKMLNPDFVITEWVDDWK